MRGSPGVWQKTQKSLKTQTLTPPPPLHIFEHGSIHIKAPGEHVKKEKS